MREWYFVIEGVMDNRDGAPWTDQDFRDLKQAMAKREPIERAAERLGPGGTVEQVREMAKDLGWLPSPSIVPAN